MCKWMQELKLHKGYASNLGQCMNAAQRRFFRIKSHDCHVFMECLLPFSFTELLDHVWKPLTKLSEYFTVLCSSIIRVDDILMMEKKIPIVLYKLKRIFPFGFFDLMDHLPVHLAYEV